MHLLNSIGIVQKPIGDHKWIYNYFAKSKVGCCTHWIGFEFWNVNDYSQLITLYISYSFSFVIILETWLFIILEFQLIQVEDLKMKMTTENHLLFFVLLYDSVTYFKYVLFVLFKLWIVWLWHFEQCDVFKYVLCFFC